MAAVPPLPDCLRAPSPPISRYVFYRFDVATPGMSVEVALTVFSGDPDLYCSFDTPHPTTDNHTFASAGGGSAASVEAAVDPALATAHTYIFCPPGAFRRAQAAPMLPGAPPGGAAELGVAPAARLGPAQR